MWSTPGGRGFIMLAAMSALFGFAVNAQQGLFTNFFEEVLHMEGPQFGYITAIREVPGFFLILLTAVLYRVSLQRVTAGALLLFGVALALIGFTSSFWGVVPWVVLSSLGFHTVLQTQPALGMSLTTESRSGRVLGQMAAIGQAGTFVALLVILVAFQFELVSFRPMFVFLGVIAVLGGVAIVRFPHLHEGRAQQAAVRRERIVFRRAYKYFYLLNLFDGARQQIFFSFGLWVLVNRFHLGVAQISGVLLGVAFISMVSASWVGTMIDRFGERRTLSLVNLGFVVAFAGYALANNVAIAILCYMLYWFVGPVAPIGAATYLRKIAVPEEVAPSLGMGVTLLHATAIVVPVAVGYILNFVGYQVPFFIASGFALVTFVVTLRLDPHAQRSAARVAMDAAGAEARAASNTGAGPDLGDAISSGPSPGGSVGGA